MDNIFINHKISKIIGPNNNCPCCNKILSICTSIVICDLLPGKVCPLKLIIIRSKSERSLDTICLFLNSYYIILNYKENSLTINEYKINIIPSDLEFNVDYFNKKTQVWSTFS